MYVLFWSLNEATFIFLSRLKQSPPFFFSFISTLIIVNGACKKVTASHSHAKAKDSHSLFLLFFLLHSFPLPPPLQFFSYIYRSFYACFACINMCIYKLCVLQQNYCLLLRIFSVLVFIERIGITKFD